MKCQSIICQPHHIFSSWITEQFTMHYGLNETFRVMNQQSAKNDELPPASQQDLHGNSPSHGTLVPVWHRVRFKQEQFPPPNSNTCCFLPRAEENVPVCRETLYYLSGRFQRNLPQCFIRK